MKLDLDSSHLDRLKPLGVDVGDFATFDAALKKFRKIVEKEGIIKRAIEKRHYRKPSEIRHDKRRKAKRLRQLRKEEERQADLARRQRLRRRKK